MQLSSAFSPAFGLLFLIFGGSALQSETVTLNGIRDIQDSAIVSNFSLVGSTYTFTIQNTAPDGVIPNLGLSFGNQFRLTSYTTTSSFAYNIQENLIAADFNFPLDFAMVGQDQTVGIAPGQSATYTWLLTFANGDPLSGVSAEEIADHQVIRFRDLPTTTGTDLAIATPEPSTSMLLFFAFLLSPGIRKQWKRFKAIA